ncbi:hypothetical protein TRICI_003521 [Trichomonascus ciferrii]|uniref:HTH APSES-type domain-containing protein n=1 Tax=Trichomonascus ciferrii TaxID=44093 RepID=A0A642V2X9_9ASCO|nr:hypothetical protein TRICI_003521 [Trichomonascus ciferrii]
MTSTGQYYGDGALGQASSQFPESPTLQRQQQHPSGEVVKDEEEETGPTTSFLHHRMGSGSYSNSMNAGGAQTPQQQHSQLQRNSMSLSESPQIESEYGTPSTYQPIGNGLYTASYSSIPVFELIVKGVAVMRRKDDSWLNATQILKIAGIEKAKRTKVLEREILVGEHEKVQGGYGKYQGTWIPYYRGVDLCKQYGVYDMLRPLLDFEPSNQMEHTPTKEQALAKRKRDSSTTHPPVPASANYSYAHSSLSHMTFPPPPLPATVAGHEDTLEDQDSFEDDTMPDITETLDPLDPDAFDPNIPQLITRLFVQRDEHGQFNDPVSLLRSMSDQLDMMAIDVPIDESGHTALHWASALAMAPLVRELVRRGANQQRANYAGETTLVRAILVTNSFDSSVFPELLDSLYPAIPLIDKQGRTVLHHIALTAGIKGRSGASKYYLECLLEWVVRRGSRGKTGRYGLDRFMRDIVNAQDKNGDTALNIAARVGNKSIAQQLLDVGASATIANRAGLRPIEFGILPKDSSNEQQHHQTLTNSNNYHDSNNEQPQGFATKRRKEVVEALRETVNNLEMEFDQELSVKQQQVDSMHEQLRQTTALLTQRRERLEKVKATSNKLAELDRSAINLERAIEDEDNRFKEQQPHHLVDFEGNFDADEPFRVSLVNPANLPPAVILKARIAAYHRNQSKLQSTTNDLRGRSAALEQKFKRVVSLCTGVEENRVDSLLEGLVQAVQSDRDDVDVNRVAGFLRKVE